MTSGYLNEHDKEHVPLIRLLKLRSSRNDVTLIRRGVQGFITTVTIDILYTEPLRVGSNIFKINVTSFMENPL